MIHDTKGREMIADDHYELSGEPLSLPEPGTTLEQLLEQGTVGKYVLQHGLGVVAERMPKPRGRPLYTIGDDLLALEWLLLEAEGVLEPGEEEQIIDQWFSDLREERNAKLDDYAALIRATAARATTRKGEIDRMGKLLRADAHLVDRLKERLLYFLERTGEAKIETTHFRIRRQANGGQLALDWRISEDRYKELPEPLREERVAYVPNQKEIRSALDNARAERRDRMACVRAAVLKGNSDSIGAWVIQQIREGERNRDLPTPSVLSVCEWFRSIAPEDIYDQLHPSLRGLLDNEFRPTEAESILGFVDYKPRGSQVRID